jgi:UDP-glucose 4-epimerase
MEKPKIYAFGGAGFIGKAFLKYSEDAIACDSEERLERAGLEGLRFDFGVDEPSRLPCAKGDVAVIFSWRGYPAAHDLDPVGKLSTNLNCTLKLLRFLVERGVSKIVYASTGGAVYGDVGDMSVRENVPLNPIGFYGIGKATAEMYVRKICREFGVRHFILRIGNAYGVEQIKRGLSVGLIAKAVEAALSGSSLEIWGDGLNRKDYIHVDDVASAFKKAIDCKILESGFYNVGSGFSLSTKEVVRMVEKVLGISIRVRNLEERAFDVKNICLNSDLLKSRTGWNPLWKLEEGIKQMVKEIKS